MTDIAAHRFRANCGIRLRNAVDRLVHVFTESGAGQNQRQRKRPIALNGLDSLNNNGTLTTAVLWPWACAQGQQQ